MKKKKREKSVTNDVIFVKLLSDEDKKAIKIWLKESLTIEVEYSSTSVDVDILLDGEKIASGSGTKYVFTGSGPGTL